MRKNIKISLAKASPAIKWIRSLMPDAIRPESVPSRAQRERFLLLKSSQNFLLKVGEARTKFGIPRISSGAKEYEVWATKLYANRKKLFTEKIEDLLKEFRISNRWVEAVEYFVVFDKIPEHLFPPAFDYWVESGREGVLIRVNKSTSRDDIAKNWRVIEKQKQALKHLGRDVRTGSRDKGLNLLFENNRLQVLETGKIRKYSSIKTIEKYKKAYVLRSQQKKSYKEIAKELKIDTSEVSKYIERYKTFLKTLELY